MKHTMIALMATAALATACGAGGTESEADGHARQIVSLSPTATEILFEIGAGDQVVGVDSLSNFPTDAPITDLSAFQPNVEAIAGYDPDLVVVSYDPGDLIDGLGELGVAGLIQAPATSIADVYAQIEELGSSTGHEEEAADLVESMKTELADLVAETPAGDGITFFHEIDNTLYTATSSTFIGEIYGLFGMSNIADAADSDGSSFGFPQLSNEYIIDADPDLIFLSDALYSGESAATVAARPGWDTISSVVSGDIVTLDDDVASRWSPRIVELAESIAAALAKIAVPA